MRWEVVPEPCTEFITAQVQRNLHDGPREQPVPVSC